MGSSIRWLAALFLLGPAAMGAAMAMGGPGAVTMGDPGAMASGGPSAASAQGEKFLGYELGEERRYTLGPEEMLLRGESGMWSIRLDQVFESAAGEPEGVFALQHEWQAPQPVTEVPLRTIMRVKSEGSVRVNVHGFPLLIRYQTVRHLAGMGDEAYTIDYQLEDDNHRYEKRTTLEGDRWYENVPIRGHDTVDRDVPAGLFAFLPAMPGCLDRFVATYELQGGVNPQPKSAAPTASPQTTAPTTVRVVDNADCEESLFANPGLLSLAMSALWEAQGEREFVFFTPIGPLGKPETGVSVGVPAGGQPYGPGSIASRPGFGSMGGSPGWRRESVPTTAATYHEVDRLTFVERVSVRIGERMRDAWMLEVDGDIGPVYVDDDGGVLRIDLSLEDGKPRRWIRMLWPSEF